MRVITLIVALPLLIAACDRAQTPQPSPVGVSSAIGELTVASNDPGSLDPQMARTALQARVAALLFDPLLSLDPTTLRPVAGAAELPTPSADGLRYRFTLRPGLVYSDGTLLRARDFAYGLSRQCDPTVGAAFFVPDPIVGCREWYSMSPGTAKLNDVLAARRNLFANGIVALSDRELEIRLRYPAPYVLAYLALPTTSAPVRESDVERNGESWHFDPANYVGNGPFTLSEWIMDKRIVVDRNPRYRNPARLRRITLVVLESGKRMSAYLAGKVDRVAVDAELLAEIKSNGLESEMTTVPGSCTQWIRLNHARAPTDDPKFRLALAKAIDRNAYVRDLDPFALPATSFIAAGMPGHDAADAAQSFDLAAARRLLSESKYAGTSSVQGLTWRLAPTANSRQAEWIVNQWRALGLEVKVEVTLPGQFATELRSLSTRAFFQRVGWCADYADPQDWLSQHFSSQVQRGNGDFGYRSAEMDALLAEADATADVAKRDALYVKASRTLSVDAVGIWLTYSGSSWLMKPWVKGITQSALDQSGLYRGYEIFVQPH